MKTEKIMVEYRYTPLSQKWGILRKMDLQLIMSTVVV